MEDQTRGRAGTDGAGSDGAREEFRLLLEALASRAEEFLCGLGTAGDADGLHGAGHAERADGSAREPCPMCALRAVVRGERPELVSTVSDRLVDLLAVLRRVLTDGGTGSCDVDGNAANDAGKGRSASPGAFGTGAHDGGGPVGDGFAGTSGGGPATKVRRIDVQRVRGNVVRPEGERKHTAGDDAAGRGC